MVSLVGYLGKMEGIVKLVEFEVEVEVEVEVEAELNAEIVSDVADAESRQATLHDVFP